MKLEVKLFARAREVAGSDSVLIDLPDAAKVGDLRAALAERFPDLRPLAPSLLVAIGTEYADDDVLLDPAAEIACFPPVSGG